MNPKDQKVFLASARGVGEICTEWAKSNTPKGFCLTDSLADSDIVFSLKYDKIFNNDFSIFSMCYFWMKLNPIKIFFSIFYD